MSVAVGCADILVAVVVVEHHHHVVYAGVVVVLVHGIGCACNIHAAFVKFNRWNVEEVAGEVWKFRLLLVLKFLFDGPARSVLVAAVFVNGVV